jgi:putative ABC transport system permease protein
MREVVGVVADVRHSKLTSEPEAEMYVPLEQRPVRDMTLVIRGDLETAALAAAIRAEVRKIDPEVPVAGFRTVSSLVAASLAQPRFSFSLLAAFAFVAVTLAGVGVYGVIAHAVAQRTHEIGIRAAFGADRRAILRLIVGRGALVIVSGIAAGLAGALALGRILARLLFGVSAADPLVLGGVMVALATIGFAACYIPARRATRVDPMVTLRHE